MLEIHISAEYTLIAMKNCCVYWVYKWRGTVHVISSADYINSGEKWLRTVNMYNEHYYVVPAFLTGLKIYQ